MSTPFTGNNFINNNFFWFTGVIEDINDPLEMGRVRVRCFGYHTGDKGAGTGIPTGSLPWAHVMMPITSASIAGIGESATGIAQGSWVVGFFRDGDACQDPLVIGSLPSQTPDISDDDRKYGFCDPNPTGNPKESEIVDQKQSLKKEINDPSIENISMESAAYFQNIEDEFSNENLKTDENRLTKFEVDSIELATPELFSDRGDDNLFNQDNNNNEPEIFESSQDEEKDNLKEPEMFEESNLEEDFEIPAFLRKQKN